jgi:glycosyltransferase involved in cell wall biosynthesis
LVSIGMPVYNGSRYIREALASLMAQSYAEFELQISDNASSDETPDICQAYMAKDARIHYHRNPTNLGVLKNFRRALELTSGDYFMWAACDDCWSTNYLAVLLDRLRAHPGAMLAAGRTLYIDGDGDLRRNEPDDAPGRYANVRLGTARQLLRQHAAGWLHGLYRREGVVQFLPTLLATHPWGSDIVFLLQVCLNHEVVGADTAIMYKRVTAINFSHVTLPKTPRETVSWQCGFAWALLCTILTSSLPAKAKRDLLHTYAAYLKRFYFGHGFSPWMKTWVRAGCHWVMRVDRR